MPHANYNHVMAEIKALSLSDQLRLMEEMAMLIRKKANPTKARSIMELKGNGKEIWKGLDIQKYIEEERSSFSL